MSTGLSLFLQREITFVISVLLLIDDQCCTSMDEKSLEWKSELQLNRFSLKFT